MTHHIHENLHIPVFLLGRGTIVNRTCGKHKNCMFTYFYWHYLVLFTMVPRNGHVWFKLPCPPP